MYNHASDRNGDNAMRRIGRKRFNIPKLKTQSKNQIFHITVNRSRVLTRTLLFFREKHNLLYETK